MVDLIEVYLKVNTLLIYVFSYASIDGRIPNQMVKATPNVYYYLCHPMVVHFLSLIEE